MRVGVIGPVQVDAGEVWEPSRPKERILLAALVSARGTPLGVDHLADALWGERLPANPTKAVQNHVLRVRQALGAGAIETVPTGYTLAAHATSDIDELEELFRAGLDEHRPAEVRLRALRAARALRRGPVLQDLLDWPDALPEIGRIEEMLAVADEETFALELLSERGATLIADLRRAARAEPLRERRWCLLVTALLADDRPAEARVAVEEARAVLWQDGGIPPGPELAAHEAALGIEPASSARGDAPAASSAELRERVMRVWRTGRGRDLDEAVDAWTSIDGGGPTIAHRRASVRSAWLLLRGDLAGAEAEADRAAKAGDPERDHWVSPMHQAQLAAIRREQERFEQLRSAYEGFASLGTPPVPLQRAFLAHGLLLLGDIGRAGQLLDVDAADQFASVPHDDLRLTILCLYAEIAAAAHATRPAAVLTELLVPHESQVVFDGAVCLGAAARYLGLLAASHDEWIEADEHLSRAAEINRRLRAPAWLARCLGDRAEVLARQGDGRYPAEGLITAAVELTARHDLPGAAADVARAAHTIGFG